MRHGRHHSRPWRRARLRSRLFWMMGTGIVITVVALVVIMRWLGPGGDAEVGRLRDFAAKRYRAVWQSEAERRRLSKDVADLGVWLRVEDASGARLESFGPPCDEDLFSFEVVGADGEVLGRVAGCPSDVHERGRTHLFAALFVFAITLWGIAGMAARRIGRPLEALADVTRRIGNGELSARVRLGRHHSGEVGALAESVNDMAVRIDKQMRDQRELLAAVSHEIRTPLARMRVISELLEADGADASRIRQLGVEIAEVDDLVGELLASSRLDFSALDLRPVDAGVLALEVLERSSFDPTLLEVGDGDAHVECDATLVARALSNLLSNAEAHAGTLESVVVSPADDRVTFAVSDRGPGFSEETLPLAFDAFRRGQGRAGSSLGLGLALVRRIARAHGGDATAENRPEGGARVSFFLPKNRAVAG